MTPQRLATLIISLGALALPSAAIGRSWRINSVGSGDAPTIQAGIDSSVSGDSVLVSAGTYIENIDFSGKAIVVQGAGAELTTIDGSGMEEACVLFVNGETNNSVLSGFTLTGGRGHQFSSATAFGGAIYGINSEPTIEENTIADNQATTGGGGVYLISGGTTYQPQLVGNQILRNSANNGGGVACSGTQSPVIKDNIISANETTRGDGAGIWLLISSDGTVIINNQITDNVAGDHGGGIYIANELYGNPLAVEVSWNVVARNVAMWESGVEADGAGIWANTTRVWIHHNTIVYNFGASDSTHGGGIALLDLGDPIVEKNIIAMNRSSGGLSCTGGVVPLIRNNLAWHNVGGHGVGDCATWWQSDGNIVADPYFCNPMSGDYSVAQNSPALTHVAGPLGAFYLPGCGPVSVERVTWGSLKVKFLNDK